MVAWVEKFRSKPIPLKDRRKKIQDRKKDVFPQVKKKKRTSMNLDLHLYTPSVHEYKTILRF
jgi:hypothetical protein